MTLRQPQIGTWYQDSAFETIFEVVAIDDRAETIELQYANGDIDEMDLDQWTLQAFHQAVPPNATDESIEDADDLYAPPPSNGYPFRRPES